MFEESHYEEMKRHLVRRGVIATQTATEEYKDPVAAMTTVRIVRVPLEEDNLDGMCKAIARFIPTLQLPHQQKVQVRGKTKYSVIDRDAVVNDVIGCNLFLHETKGHEKGEGIGEPFLSVTMGHGMKYLLWMSGKPQRSCAFCKQSHEPIKRDALTDKRFHMACLESAKRKAMAPNQGMTLDRRLLEATGD